MDARTSSPSWTPPEQHTAVPSGTGSAFTNRSSTQNLPQPRKSANAQICVDPAVQAQWQDAYTQSNNQGKVYSTDDDPLPQVKFSQLSMDKQAGLLMRYPAISNVEQWIAEMPKGNWSDYEQRQTEAQSTAILPHPAVSNETNSPSVHRLEHAKIALNAPPHNPPKRFDSVTTSPPDHNSPPPPPPPLQPESPPDAIERFVHPPPRDSHALAHPTPSPTSAPHPAFSHEKLLDSVLLRMAHPSKTRPRTLSGVVWEDHGCSVRRCLCRRALWGARFRTRR